MEKGVWIKYDGTNKPEDHIPVRVRFPDGWVSDDEDYDNAGTWCWQVGSHDDDISHFMIKPD